MRKKINGIRILLSLMFMNIIWISGGDVVYAEQIWPAGYHEYITTEDEAIDHWYGVARGTYLKEGICGIKRAGTAKVSISGTTTAHRICDKVKVGVYLNESSNGGSSYGTVASYYFSENNTSSCYGNKIDIPVTLGWKYYASAGHSVTKGSVTEMMDTRTDALTAS